ncbi:uncharacterized protein LOC132735420 isoform X2 [Ruditapes philippinarum]|uniref:uncharacterized protein LOC132735420 isoform X2 n=1 Tax=Ruditapes philippinarum TaxID=129788 RepID=UPI00295ADE8A|nr:uncharacterized protein LOC132735420 isoform X2 [Ruditapes philippinarum]
MKTKVLFLILFYCLYVHSEAADCNTVHPGSPTFMNCQYRCHCVNDDQCSEQTGYCSNGCAPGWMGPGCQYRNIAIYKSNIQSVDGSNVSAAFDGNNQTCSYTTRNGTAGQHWLAIEWSREYLIKGLVLKIHIDDSEFYSNFLVETGLNDSDYNNICYQHPDSQGLAEMEIMCQQPVRTKHIRVKLFIEDVSLRICEVEIYGGRVTSFNKETDQISTYEQFNSSKSVDGHNLSNFSGNFEPATRETCSATQPTEENPWWLVNLGQIFEIQDIYFYGRRDKEEQFRGFNISVGNLSETITQMIFQDTQADSTAADYQPMRTMLQEIKIGQFVQIKREVDSDILTICEVLVFADCPINSCGWDCTLQCFCHEEITGNMKIAGICPNGCLSGWTGINGTCNRECVNGTYGINCAESCGYCDSGMICDRFSGHCPDGCSAGYIGDLCIDVCRNGTYGINCTHECGYCLNSSCNHVNGSCDEGCQAGWSGDYCTEKCSNGTYGMNCLQECGNCINNETCEYITGKCDNGCEDGWKGDTCVEKCDEGSYGSNCSGRCGYCKGHVTCDHMTGHCHGNCDAGYTGSTCTDACRNKTYGTNCSEVCGHCLNNDVCNHANGFCIRGCEAGWQGDRCINECSNGTYGLDCKFKCGNCQANYCIHTTGACPLGCLQGYDGETCILKVSGPSTSPTATIVGSIVGVAVLVAIVLAILIFRRLKQNRLPGKKGRKAENELSNPHALWSRDSSKSGTVEIDTPTQEIVTNGTMEPVYSNDSSGPKPIQISQLRNVCQSAKNNPSSLYAEFQTLPYGLQFDVSEARSKQYKSKNRYKDMYPYNANRVILPEIPGDNASTYINASYIDGYKTPKKYIAAQGALEGTVDDIWRMVWSHEIKIIVMLTRCSELGQIKCIQYWPDEGSKVYGDISVHASAVETYSDFDIRIFNCYNSGTMERRTVLQYHFTGWPDKDVPDSALSLAQFWGAVKKSYGNIKAPLLVHCSAGVGRTGTFIAVDYLYDQGLSKGHVDICASVRKLREQRLNMVQTTAQYMYLHEVVSEILDPIGIVYSTDEFIETCYSVLLSEDNLLQEYKKIEESTQKEQAAESEEDIVYSNLSKRQMADAHLTENIHKSRNPEIYPLDINRPRLSNVDGRNDFINAVFVKTFRQRDRMILTQVPLEDTVVDFIRMLWEFDVQTILLLEEKIEREFEYWPSRNDVLQIGPFKSELVKEERKSTYLLRTIRYWLSGQTEHKIVKQFHFKAWSGDTATPKDTEAVLSMITDMQNVITDTTNLITIQCNDGARKSGVICVLIALFERMKADGEVAIAETVRMVRQSRQQIIDSFDQYKFCYRTAKDYLESDNVYANML